MAARFLAGSTSKEIPYEVVYGLEAALSDWSSRDFIITTAIIQEQNYFFQQVDPNFNTMVNSYLGVNYDVDLIQIALPRLYRHKPLYNIALYHELGHFIDINHGVVNYTLLKWPPNFQPGTQGYWSEKSYRAEFFSDLFAASYTGHAIRHFLSGIVPDATVSLSHPATSERLSRIDNFLTGSSDFMIDYFKETLRSMGLPELPIRFSKPNISRDFSSIRPYTIQSVEELHGITDSAWDMLRLAHNRNAPPWNELDEPLIDSLINDLTEKSIRNMMITEKWRNATLN
ncbi:MAG: hypothetical protein HY272_02190 [Gammaproteobacteria bacterium]|nr:hypothetical protein [Gammaproteobacteria bacterium]